MLLKKSKQNVSKHDTYPIFFCESCGDKVSDGDMECPGCGKRFAGVKCPRCFYEGSTSSFVHGCPVCHFKPVKTDLKKDFILENKMTQNGVVISKDGTIKEGNQNVYSHKKGTQILSAMTMVGSILVALILVFFLYMCTS